MIVEFVFRHHRSGVDTARALDATRLAMKALQEVKGVGPLREFPVVPSAGEEGRRPSVGVIVYSGLGAFVKVALGPGIGRPMRRYLAMVTLQLAVFTRPEEAVFEPEEVCLAPRSLVVFHASSPVKRFHHREFFAARARYLAELARCEGVVRVNSFRTRAGVVAASRQVHLVEYRSVEDMSALATNRAEISQRTGWNRQIRDEITRVFDGQRAPKI